MLNMQQIKKLLQKIQVVRSPKHRLATFGTSQVNYQLVTDVPGLSDRSRLRVGVVTAQKPAIITPQSLKEKFIGFGADAKSYFDSFVNQYGQAFQGLEYQFRNEIVSHRVELISPEVFTQQLIKEFDRSESYNNALIRGSDQLWELSVMKFIVEETIASFSINYNELNERGFFSGEDRTRQRQKREVENLFKIAKKDPAAVRLLGAKLKEYDLFETYQDAFFKLVHR